MRTGIGVILASGLIWATSACLIALDVNRSIAAMALVLEVLAVAASGDWLLAVLASIAASLAFSWYYIDAVNSFRITSAEGGTTLAMMIFTALTGSHLAVRAQRRAEEAIGRREEMERLHQLGNVLLLANTVQEAADNAVRKVVELFGVPCAILRLEHKTFQAGAAANQPVVRLELESGTSKNALELYGVQPSAEVSSALANLIKLVLDRARNAEDRARIEAAQRGEELRTTVLNALAHNFKTPLTSIKAAASMLRGSNEVPSAQGKELVVVIDEEADRLAQLIRESLDLAQIESRQIDPRRDQCSFSEIAAGVVSRVSRYLAGRELIIDISEDLPAIEGDQFLFSQMLMQVVDNACKYSRHGSRIEISALAEGSYVILTVRNEGIPIPDDEKDRIFDRFYRGAGNRSRIEGTGLGLAIAKTIAEAHGGSVWLESEPGGPAFKFSLPVLNGKSH